MKKKIIGGLALTILAFAGGVIASYFYLIPRPKQYSEAVKWAIDNPSYTEKTYQAYKQHVRAAETLLEGELDSLGGDNLGN